ncbi:DUF6498-containing protein [Aurantivibrio plasticivorans]
MNVLLAQLERYFIVDITAFLLGLGCAWGLSWTTTDLVWSLWLSSLVVGYLTIVSIIASGVYIGWRVMEHPEFPSDKRGLALGIGGFVGIFFLGFFTLHFCGFHAGHATFLASFFPLDGVESNTFGRAFMNPVLLWNIALTQLLPLFGVFLIPVVFAERYALFGPLNKARRLAEKIQQDESLSAEHLLSSVKVSPAPGRHQSKRATLGRPKSKNSAFNDAFIGPYKNVIRMHVLIFVFAGLSYFELESFGVFALVYAVYFFPWRVLRKNQQEPIDNVEA